jgi:hypothetical protein
MKQNTQKLALLLLAAFAFTNSAVQAGKLKDIGNAAAYPFKKGVHNAGTTAVEGAGHASKGVNHMGQAAAYPVRKTGENTSKTAHKAVSKK